MPPHDQAGGSIGRIYGQASNITTYNLARMNMLLHGVKGTEFEIGHFVEGKRQSQLTDEHIQRIVSTYQNRDEHERYSRRVSMERIVEENYNLNISRYVSTAEAETEIDLAVVHADLEAIESRIDEAKKRHNGFLLGLGLAPLP